jgi:hypothetical protein
MLAKRTNIVICAIIAGPEDVIEARAPDGTKLPLRKKSQVQ